MSLRMSKADAEQLQQQLKTGQKKKKGRRSKLEDSLVEQLKRIEAPEFACDYRWHSTRDWRWDIAFVDQKIAIEVDGIRLDGRGDHQTEKGTTNDCQKLCNGVLWGWTVLRVTGTMVKSGEAAELIMRILTRQAVPLNSFPTAGFTYHF